MSQVNFLINQCPPFTWTWPRIGWIHYRIVPLTTHLLPVYRWGGGSDKPVKLIMIKSSISLANQPTISCRSQIFKKKKKKSDKMDIHSCFSRLLEKGCFMDTLSLMYIFFFSTKIFEKLGQFVHMVKWGQTMYINDKKNTVYTINHFL